MASPSRTTTTTTTPNGSRTCSLLLLTVLVLSTLLTPTASISFLEALKPNGPQHIVPCPNMEVSAICFQCSSLDPTRFYDIHNLCCGTEGRVRQLCREWYTEEPKRGRRDAWYY